MIRDIAFGVSLVGLSVCVAFIAPHPAYGGFVFCGVVLLVCVLGLIEEGRKKKK